MVLTEEQEYQYNIGRKQWGHVVVLYHGASQVGQALWLWSLCVAEKVKTCS